MAFSERVLFAIGFFLLEATAVVLPYRNITSGIPRGVDDAIEEETGRAFINDTTSSGPGSACSDQDHCGTVLVCLVSGTCGCPEHVPVLMWEAGVYACVSSRRLKEFCLSDAECSHENNEARCVDSLCRCHGNFYESVDGSACLPKISTWQPLMTTMFPAVLLILALIVIALVGYMRLSAGPDAKAHTAMGFSFSPRSIRQLRTESLRKWFKPWRFERLSVAGNQLRIFILTAAQRFRFLTFQWDWSRLEEDVVESYELTHVAKPAQTAREGDFKTDRSGPFHWATFDVADASSRRSRPSVRQILMQESTEAQREGKSALSRAEELNDQARKPATMPRTRISTLSTCTLMPKRTGRRSNLSSPVTSPATKETATNALRGLCDAHFTPTREAPDEESGACSANIQNLLPRPTGPLGFTRSELSGGMLRKYRSEVVEQPDTPQDRRTVSECLDPLEVSVTRESTASSRCYQSSSTPRCCSSSQGTDCSLWTTVSCVTASESEDTRRAAGWMPLTTSRQPSLPCEHDAWKSLGRRARTCEAFTVLYDSRPVAGSPEKNATAHPHAEVPQFIYSRWPPARDRTRWRRRVPFTDGATSATAGFPAAAASTAASVHDHERPRGQLIGSGEGGGRRQAFMTEAVASRSPRHGSQGIRLPPPPRFRRGSLSLDTTLATGMLRAERRSKGSSF